MAESILYDESRGGLRPKTMAEQLQEAGVAPEWYEVWYIEIPYFLLIAGLFALLASRILRMINGRNSQSDQHS